MGAESDSNPKIVASAAPEERNSRRLIGRWLSVGIVASAAVLGLIILFKTNFHPRTDDATVLANYIGIAPQVEGPLVRLPIQDNQFVRKGELLFEIDERPFQYALERALSDQATLEGQIVDETRRIAALKSAVVRFRGQHSQCRSRRGHGRKGRYSRTSGMGVCQHQFAPPGAVTQDASCLRR